MIPDSILDEIRRRLPPPALVDRVLTPVKRRESGNTYCCAFHNERNGSMDAINKPGKRFIYCHGCGWSGDIFKFTQEYYGKTFPETVEMLAGLAGVDLATDIRAQAAQDRQSGAGAALRRDKFQGDAQLAAQEAKKAARIRDLWRETKSAAGSVVETYLRYRGYRGALLPDLRWHPGVWYRPDDGEDRRHGHRWPAMISRIVGLDGRGRALHVTYLRPDGLGKAPVGKAKKVLGPKRGGAIWLAGAEERDGQIKLSPTVVLVEGIESGLRVRDALWDDAVGDCHIDGELVAVCCTLDLGGMATVELPGATRTVVICAENDMVHADLDSARPVRDAREVLLRAQEAHRRQGREVRIAQAPLGLDFDDLAKR